MTALPPRLLLWDGSPEVRALAPAGLQPSTAGVAAYLDKLTAPTTTPSAAGFRHYQAIQSFSYDTQQRATVEASAGRIAMHCLWPDAGDTSWRYGEDVYRRAATGWYDMDLRRSLTSFPIGVAGRGEKPVRLRVAFCHEADGYSPEGTDRRAYVAAVQHLIMVVVDWGLLVGVTPDELGVGGLLTTVGMEGTGWEWWEGLPQWVHDSGYLVGFWDAYFKVKLTEQGQPEARAGTDGRWYRHEPFREKVDRHIARFESAGLTRFILAETAMGYDTRANPGVQVATVNHHLAWFREVTAMLREGRLEGVYMFHKDDGPMSMYGSVTDPGREAVAREHGWRCKEFNRVP